MSVLPRAIGRAFISIVVGALFLAALSLPVFAGGAKFQDQAEAELRFGVFQGPTALGLVGLISQTPDYAADNASYPQMRTEIVASPDQMVARLVNGELDAAVLPFNLAVKLGNAGQPIRIAAVTGTGMLSMVTADPEVHDLKDLAGREVYVAGQGSTPDIVFRRLIQGIEPAPVPNFSLPQAEIASALVAGRIQIAVLPEPFATMAVLARSSSDNPLEKRIDLEDLWYLIPGAGETYPMTALVLTDDLLNYQPRLAQDFLLAARDSLAWVNKNHQEAGELIAQLGLGMAATPAALAVPDAGFTYLPAGSTGARQMIDPFLELLLREVPESIGGKLPRDDLYLD